MTMHDLMEVCAYLDMKDKKDDEPTPQEVLEAFLKEKQ